MAIADQAPSSRAQAALPEQSATSTLPGLDGWRGLALLLVVVGHHYILGWAQASWVAMQMFFVLSGFLITMGLLRTTSRPLGEYLRVFYWRRALRIFPPYYLYLALLSVLAAFVTIKGVGALQVFFAATYVYNFYHAAESFTHSFALSHFWSLAVEEQFYLVWPMVIYFVPRRSLLTILWSIVAAGPLLRLFTYWACRSGALPVYADTPLVVYVLPWSHFDAFAMGALVSTHAIKPSLKLTWVALGAVALLGALQLHLFREHLQVRSLGYPFTMPWGYQFVWGYSAINLCSALLVASIASRQFLPWLFESRVLRWLGRISYTVYVFHYAFQLLAEKLLPHASELLRTACQLAIVIPIAMLSQRYLEAPLMAFKARGWGRFPAEPQRATPRT